jgi:polyhydroxybutyrate depolymerase
MRLTASGVVAALALVLSLAGCGRPGGEPAANTCSSGGGLSAGTSTETLNVGGKQRRYLLTTPTSTAGSLLPVVFDFPGLGESAEEQEKYSQLGEKAAARGWLGVTPQESGALWTIPPLPGPDDVSFFRAMVADVEGRFCADPARVYAAGISNGAAFVGVLGCKATSLLAGIAMVEGINAYATCGEAGPLPVVGFNGTDDPIVPFNGGNIFGGANQQGGGIVPAAPKAFEQWTQRNGCAPTQKSTDVTNDAQLLSGVECKRPTELYVLQGGGHTWAGAPAVAQKALGPTVESVSATQLILDFFAS